MEAQDDYSCQSLLHHVMKHYLRRISLSFILLIVVFSLLGYMWFLISHPVPFGDTIKATYMLHAIIISTFLGAEFLERIRKLNQNI
jgi:hypothetical protein